MRIKRPNNKKHDPFDEKKGNDRPKRHSRKAMSYVLLAMSVSLLSDPAVAERKNVTYTNIHFFQTGVRGKVLDGLNVPVPGVTVLVKGTTTGVQTDAEGNFNLPGIPENAVLVLRSLGYGTKEVPVEGKSVLTIHLQEDHNALDEVVVVAYGTVNRALAVGSAAQINAKDIDKRPITNVMNALVGAAPGVQSSVAGGAPGSGASVRIRGIGSISGSNDALTVVDGAVFEGDIASINPADIESISVLKDASTTAMYGSRGANGVLMITTKKGSAGNNTLHVQASKGWVSRGLPEYERVNAQQYYPLMWEAYRNSLQYGQQIPIDIAGSIASGLTPSYNGNNYSGIKSLLGYNPFNVGDNEIVDANGVLNPNAQLKYADDLNWADQTTQGGKSRQNYNLSYSGGSGKSNYFGSLGYTNEKGYLINSDLKRYTGRLNVDTQPVSFFKTGLNVTGTYSTSQYDNSGNNSSFINPFYISRFMGPIYPVHLHDPNSGALILDENGQRRYDFGDGRPFSPGRHAIFENLNDTQNRGRGQLGARAYGTAYILPGLTATAKVSFDLLDTHERTFDNPSIGDGAPSGRAYSTFLRTTVYTVNELLEYTKKIGQHNFNILAGHENFSYKYNSFTGSRSGQIVGGITELVNFATALGVSSFEHNARVESYISRVNYDYDGKYVFTGSLRRDGNSKFAPAVRWKSFWSVGGAYNINRESFFDVSWIDQLKLRVAYGTVGNDGGIDNVSTNTIGYYPYQALYLLGRNNQSEAGFTQNSLANEELTWETAKNFDVGTDFSMFKGRLSGSVEYFNRTTDGLIFPVPQPISLGGTHSDAFFEVYTNVGSLYNRGVELQLTGDIVRSGNFHYSTTLNLTRYNNKITKMPEGQALIVDATKALSVGHSVYDFYLREFYGVDSETGEALYRTNEMTSNARLIGQDTVTTSYNEANLRYTGDSSIPDIYGSMAHNFSYKNFSLAVQFTFQLGGKVYDSAYAGLMHGGTYGTAMSVDALNRWQSPGQVTDVPRLDNGRITDFSAQSSRYLTSASYLQLNMISLSYNLPERWLEHIKAQNASIFFNAENLATFTKRKGMNAPGSFNGTVNNNYNFNRIVSLGLNVNF